MNTVKIKSSSTKMVAHRGVSGIEKENTNASFIAAGNRSYFGIETDVHKTSDGFYVCFHDDSTARVAGDEMTVEKTSFDTLRSLKLTDRDGSKGRIDLRIPTLAEYIDTCKRYEKTAVLELKNEFTTEEIGQICAIIKEVGWLDNVIFISFCFENLVRLRTLYPEQTVQFLTDTYTDDLPQRLSSHSFDLDILYTELNHAVIDLLHNAGIKINCWTCDDPVIAEKLVSFGIDYITSNILE